MTTTETTNPRAAKLARHIELRDTAACDYCGTLKNRCSRKRRARSDRYKAHRRGPQATA